MANNQSSFDDYIQKAIEVLTLQFQDLRIVSALHKETMASLRTSLTGKQMETFEDMEIRHGLHSLITIVYLDLLSILKLYKNATTVWEKSFLINRGYLTMYEAIKAYEDRKKRVRDLVLVYSKSTPNFDEINNDIKAFKKKFDYSKISTIRNKVAGHIDEDFDLYYDTLLSIEPQKGVDAIQSLIEIVSKIDRFLSELRAIINTATELQTAQIEAEIETKKKELLEIIEKLKN